MCHQNSSYVLVLFSHCTNLMYADLGYLSQLIGIDMRKVSICLFLCDFIVLMRTVILSAEGKNVTKKT